jgi:hypothetical protein
MSASWQSLSPVEPSEKRLVECRSCKVLTANPVRIWWAGSELCDICRPCHKNLAKPKPTA